MAVVTCHDTGDDLSVVAAHEEEIGSHGELAPDVFPRVVPGAQEVALLPEGDDGFFVFRLEGADEHWKG
jgi:hypothetical protein